MSETLNTTNESLEQASIVDIANIWQIFRDGEPVVQRLAEDKEINYYGQQENPSRLLARTEELSSYLYLDEKTRESLGDRKMGFARDAFDVLRRMEERETSNNTLSANSRGKATNFFSTPK